MKTQDELDAEKQKADTERRIAEILAELDAIDKKKARPLTAFILKEETKDDTRILKELDKKAKELREEKKLLEEIK